MLKVEFSLKQSLDLVVFIKIQSVYSMSITCYRDTPCTEPTVLVPYLFVAFDFDQEWRFSVADYRKMRRRTKNNLKFLGTITIEKCLVATSRVVIEGTGRAHQPLTAHSNKCDMVLRTSSI